MKSSSCVGRYMNVAVIPVSSGGWDVGRFEAFFYGPITLPRGYLLYLIWGLACLYLTTHGARESRDIYQNKTTQPAYVDFST